MPRALVQNQMPNLRVRMISCPLDRVSEAVSCSGSSLIKENRQSRTVWTESGALPVLDWRFYYQRQSRMSFELQMAQDGVTVKRRVELFCFLCGCWLSVFANGQFQKRHEAAWIEG